ncbi:protein MpPAL-like1 [Marchantia polymorpha subsp. ruderalis]|nr:hypothetical protein MARPO_0142s0036 [Marchantia polymorpha]BBN06121.1 hypothetical protein Mp_3g18570 [Marchantia polymorpha subsp. ruderalis]|eukprot:PTQ29409.1 hypothetical protein MARPO_0142s0036 [Marchantia polymorpha]
MDSSKHLGHSSAGPSPSANGWVAPRNHFVRIRDMMLTVEKSTVVFVGRADPAALTIEQVTCVSRNLHVKVSILGIDCGAQGEEELQGEGRATNGTSAVEPLQTCNQASSATETAESIRFLTAGVASCRGLRTIAPLDPSITRAALAVRTNTLLNGYGRHEVRWEILHAFLKLLNQRITPQLPTRGCISASGGDLLQLSYLARLLKGQPNVKLLTESGEEIEALEALRSIGLSQPLNLQPKEEIAIVNGTSVSSALAATICYDVNVLALLATLASVLFCEIIQWDGFEPQFPEDLTTSVTMHPRQLETVDFMEFVLRRPSLSQLRNCAFCHSSTSGWLRSSSSMDSSSDWELHGRESNGETPTPSPLPSHDTLLKGVESVKVDLDRAPDLFRCCANWLGEQVEGIQAATEAVQMEINSVNFQGAFIGPMMEILRSAIYALGKLMNYQLIELARYVEKCNLPGEAVHGAKIVMGSYACELSYMAHPLGKQSQISDMDPDNAYQSLGFLSGCKTAEAVTTLQLMCATSLVALCQVYDLQLLEASAFEYLKYGVSRAAVCNKFGSALGIKEEDIGRFNGSRPTLGTADHETPKVFTDLLEVLRDYSPFHNDARSIIPKLEQVLKDHGIEEQLIKGFRESKELEGGFHEVDRMMNDFNKHVMRNISAGRRCKGIYPVYSFVRKVGTKMMIGKDFENRVPGEDVGRVYEAICGGEMAGNLLAAFHDIQNHL